MKSNVLTISSNKMKHSIAVARYMQNYARENLLNEELSEEFFILGYLHDIGEEFCSDKKDHAKVGGMILKKQKYRYWKEVYYHGTVQNEYSSIALSLLNLAELCIDGEGNFVGIDTKLERLKEKFGEDSVQYRNTKLLADQVRGQKLRLK